MAYTSKWTCVYIIAIKELQGFINVRENIILGSIFAGAFDALPEHRKFARHRRSW